MLPAQFHDFYGALTILLFLYGKMPIGRQTPVSPYYDVIALKGPIPSILVVLCTS